MTVLRLLEVAVVRWSGVGCNVAPWDRHRVRLMRDCCLRCSRASWIGIPSQKIQRAHQQAFHARSFLKYLLVRYCEILLMSAEKLASEN